jgi:dihydroorotate dehydrogenase (NAD+) catalytic subunit
LTLTGKPLLWQIKPEVCPVRRFIPLLCAWYTQAAHAVGIPVIGMGGIATAEDAIEMILAGADAVSVGTANFHNPAVTMEIVDGIAEYMERQGFRSVAEMVGIVQ